jgi:hypothetical protein
MNTSATEISRIETGQVRLDGKRTALADKAWNTGGILGLLVWYASLGHDPQWYAQYTELGPPPLLRDLAVPVDGKCKITGERGSQARL